jgi:hypothetical protein
MQNKNIFILGLISFVISLFFACAKPNYQDPQPQIQSDKPGPQNPQNPETCKLFFTTERICVDLNWEKMPTETDTGSFFLKFYVQETPTKFIDPRHNPAVVLWMTSMGHGSSPVTVEKISTGEYKATKVFFIMPGEWDIRLQLKDGKDVVDQIIKKIKL